MTEGYTRYALQVKLTRKSRNVRGILTPANEVWQLNHSRWDMIEPTQEDFAALAPDSMAGYSRLFAQADFSVEVIE